MKTQNAFIAAVCDQAGEVCELARPVATPAPTEFKGWFNAAYPLTPNGFRPAYELAGVMALMKAAWTAGQAALAESIGAGGVGSMKGKA
jgi:hypothetical protein